jgi:hypothetical protein
VGVHLVRLASNQRQRGMTVKCVAILICVALFGCAQSHAQQLDQTLTDVAKPSADDAPTNLTGDEFAANMLKDVVTVKNIDRADAGTGFIVGVLGDKRFILTASHVISSVEGPTNAVDAVSHTFQIARCDDLQQKSSPLANDAHVVFNDPIQDFALLEVTSAPGDILENRILSIERIVQPLTPIWTIGKTGTCAIGSGQIHSAPVANGLLFADLPGGFGGTSGAPVATAQGVIGMVLSEAGAAIVKMRSIEQIHQAVANRSDLAWSLTDSHNLPPSSPEDVQFELTAALNSYVFALKDIRDALSVEHYTVKDLASRIVAYNAAINKFNAVKDKFDRSIAHAWGQKTLMDFAGLRDAIADIHRVILGLNVSMDALRRQKVVPADMRRKMIQLSPRVDALDRASNGFIEQLKGRK